MNRKLLYILIFIIELLSIFLVPNHRRTYTNSEYQFVTLQSGEYSITSGQYFVGDTIHLLGNEHIEFHNDTFLYYMKGYRGDDLSYSVQEYNRSTSQSEDRHHELMVLGYFIGAVLAKRSPLLLVVTFTLLGFGFLLCEYPAFKSVVIDRKKNVENRSIKKYPLGLRVFGIVMLISSIIVESYYLFY
jgi:hypothetical protein